jgi:hypothetical protein
MFAHPTAICSSLVRGGVVCSSKRRTITPSVRRLASDVREGGGWCAHNEGRDVWVMPLTTRVSHLRGVGRTAVREEASSAVIALRGALRSLWRQFILSRFEPQIELSSTKDSRSSLVSAAEDLLLANLCHVCNEVDVRGMGCRWREDRWQ